MAISFNDTLKTKFIENFIRDTSNNFISYYVGFGRNISWEDDENPPNSNSSVQSFHYDVQRNLLFGKKITSTDVSFVTRKVVWQSGTVYDQYDHTDKNLYYKNYYVVNSSNRVYKCLFNNGGAHSTVMPEGVTLIGDFNTGDGYKWKYMFSIDAGTKLKFLDNEWMPVPVSSHRLDITQSSAGAGDIPIINIYNSGSGYTNDTGLGISTKVSITGDGTGANAVAIISGNTVSKIVISNPGKDYTFATVQITPNYPYSGNGAILIPEISPIGGHGFDLLNELGCRTVMITAEFNSTEQGTLPGDIDYRQIGLLSNPIVKLNNTNEFANSYIYRLTHDVVLSPGNGTYVQDEYVFQGTDLANSTYKGRVLNFDAINNILYLINTDGTISINDLIKSC